jgi:transcriptional regulator with XRE-family HTH domain
MYSPDTMKQLVDSFGAAVRQLREKQGWSQEVLAERADLNRSYVGELERGQAIPSLLTLKKLSVALNLSLTSLLKQTEMIDQTKAVHGIALASIAC